MSLRISAWVCVCLLLAGCGFQSVYGKKEGERTAQALAGVDIAPASREYNDQMLYNQLEDKFNPAGVPSHPLYRLSYGLAMSESAIGIARDGTVTRYNVNMDATYSLTRISDDAKIAQGSLRHVSSYNNPIGAYYSTYISKEDAIKRGIGELAEMYRARLSPFLVQKDPKPMNATQPQTVVTPPAYQPVFNQPELAPRPIR